MDRGLVSDLFIILSFMLEILLDVILADACRILHVYVYACVLNIIRECLFNVIESQNRKIEKTRSLT